MIISSDAPHALTPRVLGKVAGVQGVSCDHCPWRHPTHTCNCTHRAQIMINMKEHSRNVVEGQTWRLAEEISSRVLALETFSPFFSRPVRPPCSSELDSPRCRPQEQPERKCSDFIVVTVQQGQEGCGLSGARTRLHHRQRQRLTVTHIAGFSKANSVLKAEPSLSQRPPEWEVGGPQ